MKVATSPQTSVAAKTRAQPFRQLLAEARATLSPPKPRRSAAPQVTARSATPAGTRTAQVVGRGLDTEGTRLRSVRAELEAAHGERAESRSQHVTSTTAKTERQTAAERLMELIVEELNRAQPSSPSSSQDAKPPPPPLQVSAQPMPPSPQTQTALAAALVERIETFIRAQRPGVCLHLDNSLGAKVEVERVGPQRVALRLVGHKGPPSAATLSRIREALRAKGLSVAALSVE